MGSTKRLDRSVTCAYSHSHVKSSVASVDAELKAVEIVRERDEVEVSANRVSSWAQVRAGGKGRSDAERVDEEGADQALARACLPR